MAQRSLHPLISFLLLFISTISYSQDYLVSATFLGNNPKQTLQTLAPFPLSYDVSFYKITYNTTDVDGTPTIASGMIVLPLVSSVTSMPMLAYCHGTVLLDDDVPSRNNSEAFIGKLFAADGYAVVMPDYLGFGDHPGLHPYIHANSEATSTVDALRALKEYLEDDDNLNYNDETYLTGYSQGGHAAMAAYKYIQDNNLYNELNVKAATPCSGPYQMSGVQAQDILSSAPYSTPGYVVYLLFSYELAYGNIYNSYSDILQSPYDSIIPPLFDGTHDMGEVNNVLPNVIDSFLTSSFLTSFRSDSVAKAHPLWQALMDNDNYDWNPQRPLRMYYCTQDEQVFFQNSLQAETAMNNNGAADVESIESGALNHGACVFPAVTNAANFMRNLRSDPSAVPESIASSNQVVALYPNPANTTLDIFTRQQPSQVTIYSLTGKVMAELSGKQNSISVQEFDPGVYIVAFQFDKDMIYKRLIVEN